MSTNYLVLKTKQRKQPKKGKSTKFRKKLTGDLLIENNPGIDYDPEHYKNIVHIGKDIMYGDVFKAYDEDESNFTLFFGKKGSEFKK